MAEQVSFDCFEAEISPTDERLATSSRSDELLPTSPAPDHPAWYPPVVESPEKLVGIYYDFDYSSPRSSPASSHLDQDAYSTDTDVLERRRKNAEAAAKSRMKKKAKQEVLAARVLEMEREYARIQEENNKLQMFNKSLKSQLSFLKNLLSTAVQQSPAPGDLPFFSDELANSLDCDYDGTHCPSSGQKRRHTACHAVVLAAILSFGSNKVFTLGGPSSSPPIAFADGSNVQRHHGGRTLLSLDATGCSDSSNFCPKLPFLASSMLCFYFDTPPPLLSAIAFALVAALRLFAIVYLARLVSQALPAMRLIRFPLKRLVQQCRKGRRRASGALHQPRFIFPNWSLALWPKLHSN